jgi:hypothetical protein
LDNALLRDWATRTKAAFETMAYGL